MIQTKEEKFLAEMGINAQATIEGDYTATYKLKDLLKEYAEQCNIADVMAILPTESQLDEIAFRKYGNDSEGAIKFNLIKRMAFVEGCEFMLRLLKGN